MVLLGDSLTRGTVSGGFGSPYAEVVEAGLGPSYQVANSGCGGASSRDWTLSRASTVCGGVGMVLPGLFEGLAVPALPSDFAVILPGTHDALGFMEPGPVPPADYRAAIEEIIDICSSHPEVVCGPDLFELLEPYHFAHRDIHPNAAGHMAIAIELGLTLFEVAPVDAAIEVFRPVGLPLMPAALPVVIDSEPGFDAGDEARRSSLSFGVRGDEDSLLRAPEGRPGSCREIDVDADGVADLACAFELRESGLRPTSSEAWLMGRLTNGAAVEGHDTGAFGARRARAPTRLLRHLRDLSPCSRRAGSAGRRALLPRPGGSAGATQCARPNLRLYSAGEWPVCRLKTLRKKLGSP